MECFRIDEGENTGFDLLNPDQLFQDMSAIAISDQDAARLNVLKAACLSESCSSRRTSTVCKADL